MEQLKKYFRISVNDQIINIFSGHTISECLDKFAINQGFEEFDQMMKESKNTKFIRIEEMLHVQISEYNTANELQNISKTIMDLSQRTGHAIGELLNINDDLIRINNILSDDPNETIKIIEAMEKETRQSYKAEFLRIKNIFLLMKFYDFGYKYSISRQKWIDVECKEYLSKPEDLKLKEEYLNISKFEICENLNLSDKWINQAIMDAHASNLFTDKNSVRIPKLASIINEVISMAKSYMKTKYGIDFTDDEVQADHSFSNPTNTA